jgi:hypothetical protein
METMAEAAGYYVLVNSPGWIWSPIGLECLMANVRSIYIADRWSMLLEVWLLFVEN